MGCSLTDPAGCLADLAGNAAGSIADSAFSQIAKDFGNAAGDAVNWLWRQISGATAVSLTGSAMTRDLAIVERARGRGGYRTVPHPNHRLGIAA